MTEVSFLYYTPAPWSEKQRPCATFVFQKLHHHYISVVYELDGKSNSQRPSGTLHLLETELEGRIRNDFPFV